MKAVKHIKRLSLGIESNKAMSITLITTLLILGSCSNNDNENDPAPPVACQMISHSATGTMKSLDVTTTINRDASYTYDDKGNRLSITINGKYISSNGGKDIQTTTANFEYDDDGFLTRQLSQDTRFNSAGLAFQQSFESKFEYQNERLTREARDYVVDGFTKTYIYSYEYDDDGHLVKYSTLSDNSYQKFDYFGDKLVKITFVEADGNSRTPFMEFNLNGQLVKSIDTRGTTTEEYRFEYDAKGLLIRSERHINGKPNLATSFEYDDKVKPTESTFKGHPEFPQLQAYPNSQHNVTKMIYYGGDEAGLWQKGTTIINTYQYDAHDLPIENISTSLDRSGAQFGSELSVMQYQCK